MSHTRMNLFNPQSGETKVIKNLQGLLFGDFVFKIFCKVVYNYQN